LKFLLLGGRRKSARRDDDKKHCIYVDQYPPWLLVAIILLAIFSITDGLWRATENGSGGRQKTVTPSL
jgi:hypothetical protein